MSKGFVVWLTGLSGSGKTTISNELMRLYKDRGLNTEVMDGDEVRKGLSYDLGFSKDDRKKHAERVVFVSKLLSRNGVAVNVALISPYNSFREHARSQIENFLEVYVSTPLEICMERDPKGLYKKAKAGEIKDLTGYQDTYEVPDNPDLVIDTTKDDITGCAQNIIDKLEEKGFID